MSSPKTYEYPGLKADQDGVSLVALWMPARDLIRLTTVDRYNPTVTLDADGQGYQRAQRSGRVKDFAKFIGNGGALVPTAILVNDRYGMVSPGSDGKVTIQPKKGRALEVVDGQHRRGGLLHAIQEDGREDLAGFPVLVVITLGLDIHREMELFRIVNGSQKPVTTDLVNSILAILSNQQGDERIPDRDLWKVTCQKVIDRLNTEDGIWKGRIGLPNSPQSREIIAKSAAFHSSIQPVYQALEQYGVFPGGEGTSRRADRMAIVLHRYWAAVARLNPEPFRDPKGHLLMKSVGIHSLHLILPRVFSDIFRNKGKWEVDTIQGQMEPISLIKDTEFWSGKNPQGAKRIYGKGAFKALADEMICQYEKVSRGSEIL